MLALQRLNARFICVNITPPKGANPKRLIIDTQKCTTMHMFVGHTKHQHQHVIMSETSTIFHQCKQRLSCIDAGACP